MLLRLAVPCLARPTRSRVVLVSADACPLHECVTDYYESGTIRGDYALAVGRNICHGSDSVENAEKEIAL
jgi:hypothetical protein